MVFAVLAPGIGASEGTQPDARADVALSDVLVALRKRFGTDIVFSDDVVHPELKSDLPANWLQTFDDAHNALETILSPHDLEAEYAGDTWFIVRGHDRNAAALVFSSLILVRDAQTRVRVPSARVAAASADIQIEQLAGGAFRGTSARRGTFSVTVSAPAYKSAAVSVLFDKNRDAVTVVLQPAGQATLENLVVSTSRYGVLRAPSVTTNLDQQTMQIMPKVGDDPLRLVRRLPGAASGGLSARVHLRGGKDDETALVLDGLRLTEPFHLRDYQSVFSAIDRRVLSDVDVYTGAFPAAFGDTLSGVIEMRTIEPVDTEHEFTASFFNLSAFSSGTFADADGDWVLSARRGNLDWVINGINEELGDPDYRDLFGRVSWSASEEIDLSLNLHRAVDDVTIIPESPVSERVEGATRTRNTHLWATASQQWTLNLYSRTILSYAELDNDRTGFSNDQEDVVGSVSDDRRARALTLKQDWTWRSGPRRQLRFGWLASDTSTRYRYRSARQFFDESAELAGTEERLERASDIDIDGSEYAAYISTRFVPAPRLVLEAGLRWDRQTWTGDDDQWSPRASALFTPQPGRRVRLSVGRFFQSQKVHELQVEDGLTRYLPAERADQVVLGLEQDIAQRWQVRLEAYYKRLERVRPRFENLFDPLIILPELAPDRVRIDAEKGLAKGVELRLGSIGEGPLGWWVSYTRSSAIDRIDGRRVRRSWDQPHAVSAGLSWRNERWDLSIAGLYRSGWPTTTVSLDDDDELQIDERNAQRLGYFLTIDAHAARHFNLGRARLTVFLDVINATDRSNPCCVGFDLNDETSPPVVVREVDHWLPLIPSLGFRVRF